ncbi:dihydrofolate reductase family protein [uncultured Photobacterium sp.]|uniref:dihydrofolate reductase family protein n=1 Tax=uncultured Photobacterium sp. TaxID=173973 RepID=UPI002614FCF7|nr:dihydrofolate reductase family protein [uncultured Photobacterium sp.]
MSNIVYIATSLDGYIADKQGELDWLYSVPNPENLDFGFADFMQRIDALVMGRNTFEIICSFDCDWPYNKPVFVLSNSLESIPASYQDKAFLVSGPVKQVVNQLNQQGYHNLYIDGGKTIQSFLAEDLIDEMIITTFPILLGGGSPLFGELTKPQSFKFIESEVLLNSLMKSRYIRVYE